VVEDEAAATVDETTEFMYAENRQQQCWVSRDNPRRLCSTTIRDARGNEVEFRADGEKRLTSLEYDPVGNWIAQTISATVAGRNSKTIVRRKIEYWQLRRYFIRGGVARISSVHRNHLTS